MLRLTRKHVFLASILTLSLYATNSFVVCDVEEDELNNDYSIDVLEYPSISSET